MAPYRWCFTLWIKRNEFHPTPPPPNPVFKKWSFVLAKKVSMSGDEFTTKCLQSALICKQFLIRSSHWFKWYIYLNIDCIKKALSCSVSPNMTTIHKPYHSFMASTQQGSYDAQTSAKHIAFHDSIGVLGFSHCSTDKFS